MKQLRLCLALLLHGDPSMALLIATECRTFVQVNSGTSKRSRVLPDGNPEVSSVDLANRLAAKSALLILVATLLEVIWLLEQPSSSVLFYTQRFDWLATALASVGVKIWRQPFWMRQWGLIWSDHPIIRLFSTEKYRPKDAHAPSPTKRYVSKKGKVGYTGNGKVLKETE